MSSGSTIEQLSEEQLAQLDAELAAGTPLEAAIGHSLRVHTLASGALLIDESGSADRDSMAAALRFLARVTGESTRSVAVLGTFNADPVDRQEEHDYIGRLVVRLNIGQLVAVGHEARHLHSAAGLEGSWDGESLIVGTPEEAYDLLCGEMRGNDVVLVMGSSEVGLSRLVERFVEADS